MLQIDNTIISSDLLEIKFVCDVEKCKGACCVHGDAGAPLTAKEAMLLEKEYPNIKPFLRPEGVKTIDDEGLYYIDDEKDTVTMLIDKKECAYTYFEDGICKCGIEKAFFSKKTSFRKPISCFLYPVRTKQFTQFEGVNYDEWEICKVAVAKGKKDNVLLYKFLEKPLIQKFGKKWYEKLKVAVKHNSDSKK